MLGGGQNFVCEKTCLENFGLTECIHYGESGTPLGIRDILIPPPNEI